MGGLTLTLTLTESHVLRCLKPTREITPKLLVIGPSFGDTDFAIIAVRESCPAMKEKQDWHSPVYLGRLEYIHSRYPPRCTMGSLEFPVKICDATDRQHTRDLPNLSHDCDLWHTWSFDYFWHSLGLQVFRSKGLLNNLSPLFIGLPFAIVVTCTFSECVT